VCPDGIGDAHVQGYMDIQIDTKIGIYGSRTVPSLQSLAELGAACLPICANQSLSRAELCQATFVLPTVQRTD